MFCILKHQNKGGKLLISEFLWDILISFLSVLSQETGAGISAPVNLIWPNKFPLFSEGPIFIFIGDFFCGAIFGNC